MSVLCQKHGKNQITRMFFLKNVLIIFLRVDRNEEVEEDNVLDNNTAYDERIACPHKYGLLNALELLQTFSLFSNHGEVA